MLEEAEALSNMADSESQSLGEGMCKSGNCTKPGSADGQTMSGNSKRTGQGPGQGGNSGKSKTPTGTKTQKAKSNTAGGDVIARQLIENPNPEIGESIIPSESIEQAVDGGSGAAVGEEQVPTHLKDAHRHYFGTLKKELTKKGAGAAATPAITPTVGSATTPAVAAPASGAPSSGGGN